MWAWECEGKHWYGIVMAPRVLQSVLRQTRRCQGRAAFPEAPNGDCAWILWGAMQIILKKREYSPFLHLQTRTLTEIIICLSSPREWRKKRWKNSPSSIATFPTWVRNPPMRLSQTGRRSRQSSQMHWKAIMSSIQPWISCCLRTLCNMCKCCYNNPAENGELKKK